MKGCVYLRKILHIYIKDLKSIFTNWVSSVLIIGLIIIPSLYAWFNIYASWDPYSNTKNMPVGIVNEDAGGEINNKKLNAGDSIVKQLKKNKELEWHFESKEKSLEKLKEGDYFAVIVIPSNFTKNLSSITAVEPKKANLDYYVNEKINSVAPKITGEGSTMLTSQISEKFVGQVSKTVFHVFDEAGLDLEKNIPNIEKFENFVFAFEKALPNIHKELIDTQGTIKEAKDVLKKAQDALPEAVSLTTEGLEEINTALNYVNTGQKALKDIDKGVTSNVNTLKEISKNVNTNLKDISSNVGEVNKEAISTVKADLNNQLKASKTELSSIESSLTAIKDFNTAEKFTKPNKELDIAIKNIEATEQTLTDTQKSLNAIDQAVDETQKIQQKNIKSLESATQNMTKEIDDFIENFENSISKELNSELAAAKKTLTDGKKSLIEVKETIPEAQKVVNSTSGYIATANTDANEAIKFYPVVNEKVTDLANKLRKLDSEVKLDSIVKLLLHDPEKEMSFFEEPVKLKTIALFPVKNYGSGMAPFYGTLSLWVGALILVSLLQINSTNPNYTIRQVYFSKLFVFLTIGIFQALIMSLGTILIVGVEPKSSFFFILFCIFNSLVFMTVVYTLTSLFEDVGKALSIVILVLQIAGSGGTYPVVLLPKFFQIINPFLPFTYGIELLREALAGILWNKVAVDVTFLFLLAVIFILIGAFFKEKLNTTTQSLMKKSRKSGMFN